MLLGHPSKLELLAYAEGLVDGHGISTATARHIATCKDCAKEVADIRMSIEFAASADELSPTDELTSQIMVAARTERGVQRRAHGRTPLIMLKGMAYAAGIVMLSTFYFSYALGDAPASSHEIRVAAAPRPVASGPSPEEIRKATVEIHTLAAAVGSRPSVPRNLREWQQTRAVLALDADLAAARAALQRNPGCERANRVVNSNIQRQAQALKTLYYVERSL
jgi:anti-sigma factor RsiW